MLRALQYSLHKWPLGGTKVFVGLDNYRRLLFDDGDFGQSVEVTLYFTVLSVLPTILLALFPQLMFPNSPIHGLEWLLPLVVFAAISRTRTLVSGAPLEPMSPPEPSSRGSMAPSPHAARTRVSNGSNSQEPRPARFEGEGCCDMRGLPARHGRALEGDDARIIVYSTLRRLHPHGEVPTWLAATADSATKR